MRLSGGASGWIFPGFKYLYSPWATVRRTPARRPSISSRTGCSCQAWQRHHGDNWDSGARVPHPPPYPIVTSTPVGASADHIHPDGTFILCGSSLPLISYSVANHFQCLEKLGHNLGVYSLPAAHGDLGFCIHEADVRSPKTLGALMPSRLPTNLNVRTALDGDSRS